MVREFKMQSENYGDQIFKRNWLWQKNCLETSSRPQTHSSWSFLRFPKQLSESSSLCVLGTVIENKVNVTDKHSSKERQLVPKWHRVLLSLSPQSAPFRTVGHNCNEGHSRNGAVELLQRVARTGQVCWSRVPVC